MTLSSTPSDCDASGAVTADVTECSTPISEGSSIMQALYEGFEYPFALECLEFGDFLICDELGEALNQSLISNGVSYPDLMNELQDLAPSSPVMQALYEGFGQPGTFECLEFGGDLGCLEMAYNLGPSLDYNGVLYPDLMNELQALAGGIETSDCIVSWSDSTGNNVGEGFSVSGLAAGTYTASLTHSNGCTDTQTIEVLLECGGCMDALACNYSTQANVDDSSCIYNDDCGVCGVITALVAVAPMRMRRTTTQ